MRERGETGSGPQPAANGRMDETSKWLPSLLSRVAAQTWFGRSEANLPSVNNVGFGDTEQEHEIAMTGGAEPVSKVIAEVAKFRHMFTVLGFR